MTMSEGEMPSVGKLEMTAAGQLRQAEMIREINSAYGEILRDNVGEDTPEERAIFAQLAYREIRSGVKTLLIARNGEQPISRAIFLASKGDAEGEVTILNSSNDEQPDHGQKVVQDKGIKNIKFEKGNIGKFNSKNLINAAFDQVLVSDFFSDNLNWREEFRRILEENVKPGGSLYIVDKNFGENPECEGIKREVLEEILFENEESESKNKIDINLTWVSLDDEVRVNGAESPVAILRIIKSEVQNLPEKKS
jgi:hypothetical protein